MMDKKRRSPHFLSILIKYIIVSCLICLALIPIYRAAYHATKQNFVDKTYTSASVGFAKLNSSISKLVDLSNTITHDMNIKILAGIRGDLSNKDYFNLLLAQKFLKTALAADNFISNSYMLFPHNNLFLSRDIASVERERVYGDLYRIEGYDLVKWEETILQGKNQFFLLPSAATVKDFVYPPAQVMEKMIHLVVPVSNNNLYGSKSVEAVYLINEEDFLSYVQPDIAMEGDDSGFIYVTDKTDRIIAQKNYTGQVLNIQDEISSQRIQSSAYTVLHLYSRETGLTCVIGIPEKYFVNSVSSVLSIVLLYAGILILASILLAVFLSYRQSQPIRKLMEVVRIVNPGGQGEKNDYAYISSTLHTLDSERKEYEREMDSMNIAVRTSMLDRLLSRKIHTREDAERCRALFGFEGDFYCVCEMEIVRPYTPGQEGASSEDTALITTKINNALGQLFSQTLPYRAAFYIGTPMRTTIVFNLPENTPVDLYPLQKTLEYAADYVQEHFQQVIRFGVGTISYQLASVYCSANHALNALRFSDGQSRVNIWHISDWESSSQVIFGVSMAQKLYDLLQLGEMEYIDDLLEQISRRASHGAKMEEEQFFQMFYSLENTLQCAAQTILGTGEKLEMPRCSAVSSGTNIKDLIHSLRPACEFLCIRVAENQAQKVKRLQADVLAYIQDHFSDSSLCALTIADKFSISEKYVYQIVKNKTGKSLGEFIENLRFTKAEELLQKNMDINLIPQKIGFNSVNTFYKAFKRLYGISPGKWRSNVLGKDAEG